MNGIKMSDCKFYVNEEERTVVCVIPNTNCALEHFVRDNFYFPDIYIGTRLSLDKELFMPNSFMGKAVCSKDDKWDEELGRMIAFSRAKDKFYRSFFKRANLLVNTIDTRLGQMTDAFNTMGMKLEKRKMELEHMIETHMDK